MDPLETSANSLKPQSWNRYAYVENQPLRAIDPNGLETFLVVHGQGTLAPGVTEGNQGRQFQIAASTTAERIRSDPSFDVSTDAVVLLEVQNKSEFISALNQDYESGPIASLDVFSHSFETGLNFGGYGEDRTFDRLDLLSVQRDIMAPGGVVTLWGCNTGNSCGMGEQIPIAQSFANRLGVQVNAFTGSSEFNDQGRGNPPMKGSNRKSRMKEFFPESAETATGRDSTGFCGADNASCD